MIGAFHTCYNDTLIDTLKQVVLIE